MVDKWDGFSPKPVDDDGVPVKPVNGEFNTRPVRLSPSVVKFIAASPDELPQPLPTAGDRNWGAFVLVMALGFAWFIGLLMEAVWHII